jgi:hypothetical protein
VNFENLKLPGFGEKKETCHTIYGMRYCPSCGHHHPLRNSCKKFDCPECYFDASKRAASNIEMRLEGVRAAYSSIGKKLGSVQHLWVTIPPAEIAKHPLEYFEKKLKEYLKMIGVSGGCYFIHPWRINSIYKPILLKTLKSNNLKGGYWRALHLDPKGFQSPFPYLVEGLHFHVLGFYPKIIMKADEFKRITGWNYFASISKNRNIYSTARYLLTHTVIDGRRNLYHYFGLASPYYTRVQNETVKEFIPCPECKSEEYYKIPLTGFLYESFLNNNWKPEIISIGDGGQFPYVRRILKLKWYSVPAKFLNISDSYGQISVLNY